METLSPELKKLIGEDGFQFYRCYACGALISAMELAIALHSKTGTPCKCGSMKVQPAQVKPSDYPELNVVEMAVHLGIAEDAYVEDYLQEQGNPDHVPLIRRRFAEVRGAAACN